MVTAPLLKAQLVAAKKLIDNLNYAMGRVYPVVGHTDVAVEGYQTACPGATWSQWKGRLISEPAEATPSVDWRAEAERLRNDLRAANDRAAQLTTRITVLESALRQIRNTANNYV